MKREKGDANYTGNHRLGEGLLWHLRLVLENKKEKQEGRRAGVLASLKTCGEESHVLVSQSFMTGTKYLAYKI